MRQNLEQLTENRHKLGQLNRTNELGNRSDLPNALSTVVVFGPCVDRTFFVLRHGDRA
jgi:hypothetical protein